MNDTTHIAFPVTGQSLARAMAIEARDEADALFSVEAQDLGLDEPPEFTAYVLAMSKRSALRALRNCYRWYGELSWPDDYPTSAYRVALARTGRWFGEPAEPSSGSGER